jgi:hypothetical protein
VGNEESRQDESNEESVSDRSSMTYDKKKGRNLISILDILREPLILGETMS